MIQIQSINFHTEFYIAIAWVCQILTISYQSNVSTIICRQHTSATSTGNSPMLYQQINTIDELLLLIWFRQLAVLQYLFAFHLIIGPCCPIYYHQINVNGFHRLSIYFHTFARHMPHRHCPLSFEFPFDFPHAVFIVCVICHLRPHKQNTIVSHVVVCILYRNRIDSVLALAR